MQATPKKEGNNNNSKNNRRTIVRPPNSVCYGNVKEMSQLSEPTTKEAWFDICTIKKGIKKAPNSVKNKKVLFHRGSRAYIYFGCAHSNEYEKVLIFADGVGPCARVWKDVKDSVDVTGDCQKMRMEVIGRGVITNGSIPCLEVRLTTTGKSIWIAEEVLSVMTNEGREEGQQEYKEEDGDVSAPSFFSSGLQQSPMQLYSSYPNSAQASIVQTPQYASLIAYPMYAYFVDTTTQTQTGTSHSSYDLLYQYALYPLRLQFPNVSWIVAPSF